MEEQKELVEADVDDGEHHMRASHMSVAAHWVQTTSKYTSAPSKAGEDDGIRTAEAVEVGSLKVEVEGVDTHRVVGRMGTDKDKVGRWTRMQRRLRLVQFQFPQEEGVDRRREACHRVVACSRDRGRGTDHRDMRYMEK